jgi:hypothetical protein
VRYHVPFNVYFSAQDAVFCPPSVSCGGRGDVDLPPLKGNQTGIGFRLDVTVSPLAGQPRKVHVELRCSGAKECSAPLAQADGAGPFHFEGPMRLPPESTLLLTARVPDTTPDPLGFLAPSLHAQGVLEVEALPGPAPHVERIPVLFDGIAGVCGIIVEDGCTTFPGGSYAYLPLNGTLRRVNVTATWTPATAASDTMRLEGYCYFPCQGSVEATGASPLRMDVEPAGFEGGTSLQLSMAWTTPQGVPLRQPYHLEGWLEVQVDGEG